MNQPIAPPPLRTDAPPAAAGPTPFDALRWNNGFGRLPARFYTRLAPTRSPSPMTRPR